MATVIIFVWELQQNLRLFPFIVTFHSLRRERNIERSPHRKSIRDIKLTFRITP
jgi:hypothetical protein